MCNKTLVRKYYNGFARIINYDDQIAFAYNFLFPLWNNKSV